MATPELQQADLERDLRALGLGPGDMVLMHSSLSSLGRVAGGPQTVVAALLEVLGPEGTLVVPTFGDLGVLAATVARDPRAVRSVHPLASVAAIGPRAEWLCRDHWQAELAHGPDTPYLRLAERGGWVLLLGVDQDRNTTLHSAEELLRLPYLRPSRTCTFDTPEGQVTRSWPLFPGPHRDFIGIDELLRAAGKMRIGKVGAAVARLMQSREVIDFLVAHGRERPSWALCDNPSCADCVAQRAALQRARFARESFRLAASARLAGRHVPQMIDSLSAAGIGGVELDWVQGRPAVALGSRLAAVVSALGAGGISVSALRTLAVEEDDEALVHLATESGIGRLVVPLSGRAPATAAAAREHGLEVSFYSVATSSQVASRLLLEMQAEGLSAGFTFAAAGFARAGEKPFLQSYRSKLRRFVDQLDVSDATFEGVAAPLAEGNAEIRELISILRCASFAGWLVLTGEAGVEPLGAVCDRLLRLLQ